MSQSANTAPWSRTPKTRAVTMLAVVVGTLLALLAVLYLAGALFLLSMRLSLQELSPLTLARYSYYYPERADIRRRLTFSLVAALGIASAGSFALWGRRGRSLHGDARFATQAEIARAGLFGQHGIILGRIGHRYLILDGQQGVALAAPPRAGKGTGVVVPNALHWSGSMICVDIKRENWTLTAGWRKACGHEVFLFDPLSRDTAHWSVLKYVPADPAERINALQSIGDIIFADTPGVDPFWMASARTLLLGMSLYVFETPSLPRTIGEILRQGMASDSEGFSAHWKRIIEGRNSGRFPLSRECVRAIYDVIDLAPVTASSIRKTFTSRLDLWLNPILDAATTGDDFDLRDLRKKPISIYVGVNPDDLHRLRPVLSLFFQQAIGLQTRQLPEHNPELKLQIMMLLDEFTALGRIPVIAEAISFLPGYNVRCVLVIQTPSQLRQVYGGNAAETLLKSLAARIVFAPKDYADAKEISDELGTLTVKARSQSRPRHAFSPGKSLFEGGNISTSEHSRALLLPQEVRELGTEKEIIFYEGLRPILCQKIRYFKDRNFKARLLPPPAVAAHRGARHSGRGKADEATQDHPLVQSSAEQPEGATTGEQRAPAEPAGTVIREATTADIERLEELTLDDIAIDVSKVKVPEGEPMTEEALLESVESFMQALQER